MELGREGRQGRHRFLVEIVQYKRFLRPRTGDVSFKVLVKFIPRGQALRSRGRP